MQRFAHLLGLYKIMSPEVREKSIRLARGYASFLLILRSARFSYGALALIPTYSYAGHVIGCHGCSGSVLSGL